MNPRVKSVQALTGHQLELTFTNDERRLFDLTPYLQDGVFKPLQNMGLFPGSDRRWLGGVARRG